MKKTISLTLSIFFCVQLVHAQKGSVNGTIHVEGEATQYAQVIINKIIKGSVTDGMGKYSIQTIPYGTYEITASYLGYKEMKKEFTLSEQEPTTTLNFNLTARNMQLDEVVVTGTKTQKRQTDSPVIVNIISSKTIDNVQACNLSESLRFQPGLRVETDCQTCNYTQLRINGLAGAYSQILINGRPIFSPLTGLYGLEQIPANMIDRIEVVRGGGSSLYGSSAIGGTVNVITKLLKNNSYEFNYTYQNIDSQTSDNMISGNASIVSETKNSGISFLINHRDRDFFDANGDDFSEIPIIKNTSIGTNMFLLPTSNQKVELSLSYLDEYRFGGEMVTNKPAFLTEQSEERKHHVWMLSADYQINFNEDKTSFISYLAWQNTDRKHYTGIRPEQNSAEFQTFLENPPYGISYVSTYNVGVQFNHKVNNFIQGKQIFTLGSEYIYDDVLDEIPAYSYLIDQTTKNYGLFVQSDWEILPELSFLSGVRMDKHNFIESPVFSPRGSLLYKYEENTQLRLSFGTGFRAPQAFDSDLHIAFAGGGVSRISLSPDLKPEKSHSFSTSINYDKPTERWIVGFTFESFYNRLTDAFYLEPIGQDSFGQRFEKQNGEGATVQGFTLEVRTNYSGKVQIESGFTLQTSKFDSKVEYIDGLEGIREFTRTPNEYGFAILTLSPTRRWNATLNYIFTGTMKVPHFAGAPNQTVNEIITSKAFSELGAKVAYTLPLQKYGTNLEIYGGVKNLFNAYQNDFDLGKNRDSNFIYGPGQARTIYIGIKLKTN